MKKFYVYKLIDINDNCFYVGKGYYKTYDRIWYHYNCWHQNKNTKLKNKISKLNGVFTHEIVYHSYDEKDCFLEEIRLIKLLGRKNLCNLTDGGEGSSGRVFRHSDESKRKMSITRAASTRCIEASIRNFKKASLMNKGKRKIDQLDLDSKSFIINNYTTMTVPELSKHVNFSATCIRNWLKELNVYHETLKSKPLTDVHRQNISNSSKNSSKKKKRPVDMFDLTDNFIQSFDSVTEACAYIGEPGLGSIIAVCKGHQKTAYGYKWKYKLKPMEETK